RKVAACDEAFLQEARALLRQNDAAAAERVLSEAGPRGGVSTAECLLLLAWAVAARRQQQEADDLLDQAAAGLYPAPAAAAWQPLLRARAETEASFVPLQSLPLGAAAAAWVRGQQARAARDVTEQAVEAFRTSQTSHILKPFARYALACLGRED